MQLGKQKNQTDSFFFLAYQRQVLSFVYNCSQFFTFSEFTFTALFMLSVFVTYLLMFSTNSHVFDNFSCFCCHVFILRAGLRFPDGKLVLLPRRPNTNIPKNLKYIFINIEIWNQMLICRIDAEMYILTKIFSGICAIWHNSALCHPAPNCKKSLGPGFAPMCSSLYSPQGFDTFPISLIFISCVDLDEDP